MAHRQNEDQPARKTSNQGAAHEAKPKDWPHADQWPNYTPQAQTDNEFPEDPAASQSPSFTPQAETDNEFPEEEKTDFSQPPPGTVSGTPGRSGGTGQGRTDQGGEGRLIK